MANRVEGPREDSGELGLNMIDECSKRGVCGRFGVRSKGGIQVCVMIIPESRMTPELIKAFEVASVEEMVRTDFVDPETN